MIESFGVVIGSFGVVIGISFGVVIGSFGVVIVLHRVKIYPQATAFASTS